MKRTTASLLIFGLLTVACGGSTQAPTTAPDEPPAPASPTTTEAQNTTTTAPTTTTEAPTPEEIFLAAVEEAGLDPQGTSDEVISATETLCNEAAAIDPDTQQFVFERTTPIVIVAGPLFGVTDVFQAPAELARFVALAIENLCPENIGVLAASSDEWANALTRDTLAENVCYRSRVSTDFVVDCDEAHAGELLSFVELPDGGYPLSTPEAPEDSEAQFALFDQCREMIASHLGATAEDPLPFGTGFRIPATPEEWEAGDRRALCSLSVGADILHGSLAGRYAEIMEANEGVSLDVSTCTNERFEATLTNSSPHAVAVHVRFSQYFPAGPIHELLVEQLAPGESVEFAEDFPGDSEGPEDCERRTIHVGLLP